MLHAILIDDEAAARADLRAKLAAHGGVVVAGEAATFGAASALLANADYEVVFLDGRLGGGESARLVREMRAGSSLVFATADARYAVRAFESNAVHYLLKPVDPARLAEALRRAALVSAAGKFHLGPAPFAVPADFGEVALTAHERIYLRQCLEAWEDTLPGAHVLRASHPRSGPLPRAVCYARDREPTRLFLAGAPVSRVRGWWRALRARLGS